MGKKFGKALLSVAEIVVAYFFPYVAVVGELLLSSGVSGLANVALSSFAKAPKRQGPPPLNVTIRGTVEYRRLVFGRRRCGGVLVYYSASGTSNNRLWYVIAYAGHQSSAFGDFWLDERFIASSDIPSGSGGAVTASPWNSKVTIYKHLGTSAQTVDTNLDSAFSEWTSAHKLQGITYAAIAMDRDETVFPDGAPFSVSALIDGMLLYDARLDSTNGGSGSHRYANPSTWAFSRNGPEMVRWFLTGGSVHNDVSTCLKMYGLRDLDSRMEDSYTIAASNICDETLSGANAPPAGASTTRYLTDLEVDCGETRREILKALLDSFAGTLVPVHGKWRIYAGAYDSPVHTVTDFDLYGDLEVQDTVGHDARYNAVAPVFVDAGQQYIQATGIYRTDSSYETQDGGERIPKDLQLDGVTDFGQAQRLAEIHLRQSRMMRGVKLVGALNLMRIAIYETLTLTHPRFGWTARVFRAAEKSIEFDQEAGRVTVLTQRDDSGVWTDLLTADYDSGTSTTDVFTSDGPDAPTALSITSFPTVLRFVITLPGYMPAGAWVEIWEYTSSTPFGSATKIGEARASFVDIPKRDVTTRYYWARVRTVTGAVSGTFPATTGQSGAADLVQTGDINPDATSELVDSQPSDSSINYPTYSSGGSFRDVRSITNVSWTNSTGAAVDVILQYSALITRTGTDPSGGAIAHWIWGEYDIDGGSTVTDGADALRILVDTPTFTTRSGTIVVSVSDGSTINARLQTSMTGPAGSFDPQNLDYKGASLQLKARIR
jgi:hypothetical protein